MANPLYNALNNGSSMNPMDKLVADARRLRQAFTGNPKEAVQQLVSSGQMSQQQFNEYAQITQQIVGGGAFR